MELFKRKQRIVLSLRVIEDRCIGCEECAYKCKRRVFGMVDHEGRYYARVEYPEDCVGCGKCQKKCPASAIELKTA